MKPTYYLYTHTRLDTGDIFYVGIGKTLKSGTYYRAKDKSKARRNKHWRNIISKTEYRVDIISEFSSHKECCLAEQSLIASLGRVVNNTGKLVNLAPGGHLWKDSQIFHEYDLEGNFVKTWSSAKEIEAFYGYSYTNIYQSCKRNGRCGDHMFRTTKKTKIAPYLNSSHKKVYQFSLTGDFIKEYQSTTAASKETGIPIKSISEATRQVIQSAGGFLWSRDKCSCVVKRLIEQVDQHGNVISRYSSLIDIKNKLGLRSHNSIDNAIKGKVQKQAYGFTWRSFENQKINTCNENMH